MQHASFSWEKGAAAVLKQVSLKVNKGQLVMVVGPVGSGKSSLLAAILGELHSHNTSFQVRVLMRYHGHLHQHYVFAVKAQQLYQKCTGHACGYKHEYCI